MKRTNVYLSEMQLERLRLRAQKEGVAMAELVRRAIDAFLAWDDPTYHPCPKQGTPIPPPLERQGLSGPRVVI
jgi:CopG-like RHH_1 or ribbon-helix-helix domain, RHH_5